VFPTFLAVPVVVSVHAVVGFRLPCCCCLSGVPAVASLKLASLLLLASPGVPIVSCAAVRPAVDVS